MPCLEIYKLNRVYKTLALFPYSVVFVYEVLVLIRIIKNNLISIGRNED